ncbi:HAD hydrolase family protein [Oscillatoria sp. CS-180]|nr:HAD hydrolase family protein [Oscillatoria sp. CS-180]
MCDVDGVLTDGGLYYTENGQELKRFDVKDGQGIKLTLTAGIVVAFVSASNSNAIRIRAKNLGVELVFTGVTDKFACLSEITQRLRISLNETAYVGDDINDILALRKVGIPLSVADAVESVKEISCYTTERRGGRGAIREICDLLVDAHQKSL